MAVSSRFRILDRYIVREIVPPTGLGLIVFTFVILLQQISMLAGLLISRSADLATALSLFVHLLPGIFALTIPMAFLLGVLLAFGRLASESEIVALRASGVSPLQMLRPVLLLALVAAAATLYTTGFAQPRALTVARESIYSLWVGAARAGMKAKVFTDDLVTGMAFYVTDIDAETGEWQDVFISDATTPSRPRIIVARRGQLLIDDVNRTATLKLKDAATYSHDADEPGRTFQESFGTARIALPAERVFREVSTTREDREKDLFELARSTGELEAAGDTPGARRHRIILHRRLAIPAACLVFGVLGLALSLGNRKEARSAAFGLSIAVIGAYYVLLRTGEQAAANGLVPPVVGLWAANALLGAFAIGLLVLKQREASFDPLSAAHYVRWLPAPDPHRRRRAARPQAGREARHGRGPGLLDRYVVRHFVGFALLVLAAFCVLFLLFDLMDLFDDIQQNRVAGKVVVRYYVFYLPTILHLVSPLAALVATLATFGVLVRRNEIVGMLAGGISLYRIVAPVLIAAASGSLFLFALGESVIPQTSRHAAAARDRIKGRPPQSPTSLQQRWIMGADGRIYFYEYFSPGPPPMVRAAGTPETAYLHGLAVFDIDVATWRLREQLHAAMARWTGVHYEIERGWRRTFGETPRFRAFAEARTREIDPPAYFRREARDAESLSFFDLRDHIAFTEARGGDGAPLRVQLHKKLAFPLAAVIMCLLGVRFAFTVGRRGALYGVAVSLGIAITYWVCMTMFEAMGNHGWLPPLAAAWAPNLLFAAAGVYLMLTLET